MTDPAIARAFEEYRATGDRDLRNWLVEQHLWLARHCAWHFVKRSEPRDDLVQVACLGVLKAVERYQPSFGTSFATFAVPTVMGELRRHFRDTTWSMRVPRSVKDRHLELRDVVERPTHSLSRAPTLDEIAERAQLSVDEVIEAFDAGMNYRPGTVAGPSDADDDSPSEGIALGQDDAGLLEAESRVVLRAAWRASPDVTGASSTSASTRTSRSPRSPNGSVSARCTCRDCCAVRSIGSGQRS
jgi:RNA polymerase sigma-B factor